MTNVQAFFLRVAFAIAADIAVVALGAPPWFMVPFAIGVGMWAGLSSAFEGRRA